VDLFTLIIQVNVLIMSKNVLIEYSHIYNLLHFRQTPREFTIEQRNSMQIPITLKKGT